MFEPAAQAVESAAQTLDQAAACGGWIGVVLAALNVTQLLGLAYIGNRGRRLRRADVIRDDGEQDA